MKEALRELLSTVETVATEAGLVSGLVDSLTAALNQMESRAQTVSECSSLVSSCCVDTLIKLNYLWQSGVVDESDSTSFVDYQTRMVQSTKEIARLSQDMASFTKSTLPVKNWSN